MIKLLGELSKASPLSGLVSSMADQVSNKYDADAMYNDLRPALSKLIDQGYGFESKEVQGIVNVIRELPAYGAKRRNFEKRYLKDEYTLRELPANAKSLQATGMWH